MKYVEDNLLSDEEIDSLVEAILKYQIEKNKNTIILIINDFTGRNSEARDSILKKYLESRQSAIKEKILKQLEEIRRNNGNGLSTRERAYLAAILILIEEFKLPLVISPLPYEILRCIGLEEDVRTLDRRSMRALGVLEKLESKGLVERVNPKFEWKIAAGKPKFFFNLTEEGKQLARDFKEYKLIRNKLDEIQNDDRFKSTLETFKNGFRVLDK